MLKFNYKFVSKNNEYQFLNEDEIISAVKLGMRKTSSIVDIQFILAKIWTSYKDLRNGSIGDS